MSEIKKLFGKNVRYYREKMGFTQEQLAERLDINCRSLSFIECGTNFVSAETLENLCKTLNVTPKCLFDFKFNIKPENDTAHALNTLIKDNKDRAEEIYKLLDTFLNL